jgi:hypothetical protein
MVAGVKGTGSIRRAACDGEQPPSAMVAGVEAAAAGVCGGGGRRWRVRWRRPAVVVEVEGASDGGVGGRLEWGGGGCLGRWKE